MEGISADLMLRPLLIDNKLAYLCSCTMFTISTLVSVISQFERFHVPVTTETTIDDGVVLKGALCDSPAKQIKHRST